MNEELRRALLRGVEAALREEDKAASPRRRSRLSVGRAVLLGAGLATTGRLLASSRGRSLVGLLGRRLAPGELSEDDEPEGLEEDELKGFEEDADVDEEEDADLDEEEDADLDEEDEEDDDLDDAEAGEDEEKASRPRRSGARR